MCLGIPGKVEKIEKQSATVNIGGTRYEARLDLVEDVQQGDFVLLHSGYVIEKIDEDEAEETLNLIREYLSPPEDES